MFLPSQDGCEKFGAGFVEHMKPFLVVFKREMAVERAIDLIAKFSTSLCEKPSASDGNENQTELADNSQQDFDSSYQDDMHPFIAYLFRFLLKVSANLRAVSGICPYESKRMRFYHR